MWRIVQIIILVLTHILFLFACVPEIDLGDEETDEDNFDEASQDDDDNDDNDDNDNDDDNNDNDSANDCLLSEGFEGDSFPPIGWKIEKTNPLPLLNWHRDYNYSYNGIYCAIASSYLALGDEFLYTKEIELTGYDSYEVTFWNFGIYLTYGAFDPANLTLEVSYDASNWTQIWSYDYSDWNNATFNWANDYEKYYQKEIINLNDYRGENIMLGWRHKYAFGGSFNLNMWSIDDIEVRGIKEK